MRNPTTDTGVDVTLIEERLRLTPTERWQWNYEAARLMLALREAGARILRAPGLSRTSPDTPQR